MPYFDNLDTYINPYYLDVTPAVRAEMHQRAQYYGARTRTGINSSVGNGISNTIEWPYQKMPWAYVTSQTYDSKNEKSTPIILGFDLNEKDGAKVMSDETGMLTLYESVRNVPRLPLLTSIEISNEGQRGALLKGKFSFTFFPSMLPDGFELEAIQRIFFTPGSRVNIGFGWSVSAFNQKVNKLEFTGIIYGFNWSFNQNTSISAEVQVVAPSTLAIGLSGEQTVFSNKQSPDENQEIVSDPTGRPLPPETNIITIIQRDLRSMRGSDDMGINVSETGKVEFLKKGDTVSNMFNYFKIGLPTVVGSSFEDASAGRILLSDADRAVEQQQAFDNAVATAVGEVTESMALQGLGLSDAVSSNAVPDKSKSSDIRLTTWNQEKMTASEQLYRFLNDFEKNKGDNSKEKREWLDKWKKTYEKSNMGRYVYHEQIHNNEIKKGNTNTWNEAYWGSQASIKMKAVEVGRGSGDLDADSFDDFLLKLYEKNPTYEERAVYIKRKIAQLGAQEIEELKNFMYYGNPSSDVKKIGTTNADSDNIRAYHKFFYIQQKDQSSADGTSVLKKNTLQRDKYFWPDSLNFIVLDDNGKIKELNMKNMWQTFNDKIKNLRDKYDEKTEPNSEQQNKYIGDVRADKNFETILNNYITPSSNYAKNGKSEKKEEPKKENGDKEDSGKTPKEKVTPEQKQQLDKEIKELSTFQSTISNADVFNTKDNPTKKQYLEKYTKDTFVGGIDVKSIEDNWLTDFKYPSGTKNELIPALKSGAASKFVQKLIDAKNEQKKTGVDTAKDLIKTKSPAYQERLNNASTQNAEGGTGTGTGDTGTGDTGGGDVSSDATTNATSADQYQSQLVGQTYWYITLKDLVQFANEMMKRFENDQENSKESKKYNFQKFRIQCENNETEYQPDVKSAFPQDVYFPDISMGGYQTFNPFYDNDYSDYLRTFYLTNANSDITGGNIQTDSNGNRFRIEDDVINIGNILIGINLIINVYRQFLVDNATNISYKNITSFFDQIIRSVNAASGDTYQLVSHLFSEPETLTELLPKAENIGENLKDKLSVLSIEDTHIARKHSQTVMADNDLYAPNFIDDYRLVEENLINNEDIYSVKPFVFEATIFKPLIKNVTISSKPPKELAFAAYIAARGQEANAKGGDFRKSTPYSGDATLSRPVERDEDEYKKQGDINQKEKEKEETNVGTQGFTQEWCDNYRSILTKTKRLTTRASYRTGRNIPIGGHWLNKAIYPVEFSVTIDGINGFKFGDVLKTTMIPRHYNVDWDMVFTVTKILHKVTPSTWETTLNTAARLSLDSPLTGISVTTDRNTYIDPNIPPVRRELGESGPNPDEMRRQPG